MNRQTKIEFKSRSLTAFALVAALALAALTSTACRQTENTGTTANGKTGNASSPGKDAVKTDSATGDKTSASESGALRPVFEAYLAAEKRRDAKAMLDTLSADSVEFFREQFAADAKKTGKSIEELMQESAQEQESLSVKNPEYGKEEINGDRATLEVRERGGATAFSKIPFVREGGAWKYDIKKMLWSVEDKQ